MASKKRSTCSLCPAYDDPCLWQGDGDNPAHLIVIGKAPSWNSIGTGKAFQGSEGRLFRRLLSSALSRIKFTGAFRVYYTYCVLAGAYKPTAEHFKNCNINLRRELASIRGVDGKDPVIVTVGPDAARRLGLQFKKINDVVGRSFTINVASTVPRTCTVFPIISMADLERQPGTIEVVNTALGAAIRKAIGMETALHGTALEELTKNYIFPQSETELVGLVNHIIGYAGAQAQSGPDNWMVAIDTETNTLKSYRPDAKTLMVSVSWDDQIASAILIDHPEAPYSSEVAWREIRRLLDCPKPKVFHNFQFDYKFTELKDASVQRVAWDTMCGEHFLSEEKSGYYGLKRLTSFYIPEYAGYEDELQRVLQEDEAKKDTGFSDVPLSTLLRYAAADADATRLIAKRQLARASKAHVRDDAHYIMNNFYVPGSRVLAKMEHRGIRVDLDYLEELKTKVTALQKDAEQILFRDFSPTVKYTSPKQVADYMRKLNFESIPGTTPGSTAEASLHRYYAFYGDNDARGHFVKHFLRFRSSDNALKKHIAKKIEAHLTPAGRIHGSYHLTGTATGRLASSNPNQQNNPKMICDIVVQTENGDVVIEKGFNFKKLFLPEPGQRFLNLDIKGAELRIYTAYSKDPVMIKMLLDNVDVHSYTTAHCFGMSYEEVVARKKELRVYQLRDKAKRALFGIFYGAGPHRISLVLEQTHEEAAAFIQKCYETYPGLQPYIENTQGEVMRNRMVRTYLGRYRRFKMFDVSSAQMVEAKRQAVNFLIQSTAHDLLLSQLIEVDEHAQDVGFTPMLQVHDSIGGSVEPKYISQLTDFFDKYITDRVKEKYGWLPVPFLYELEVGDNYGELEEIK